MLKAGVGNGVAKELICITHGHALRGVGIAGRNGCTGEGALEIETTVTA